MLNIISTGSNYIIMIMCAIYAISCFTIFLPSTAERQIKRMNRQEQFMFFFHFICYGVLFLKTYEVKILALYLVQALFFKLLIFLYGHLYADSSRILMNHTCFLLQIGFVMLTRLSFDLAIKQFAIVALSSIRRFIHSFFYGKSLLAKKTPVDLWSGPPFVSGFCFRHWNHEKRIDQLDFPRRKFRLAAVGIC